MQAEEEKEEQTDMQPDVSSSQTVTPVAEALGAEPTPPEGPTSLGPLDLLPREELLTDTSNSSSSTGEEGEAGELCFICWLCLYLTNFTQTSQASRQHIGLEGLKKMQRFGQTWQCIPIIPTL